MEASMRMLALLAALLFWGGEALPQGPFAGPIQGAVVMGIQPFEPLAGVVWRVEAHGELLSGKTDAFGRFSIDLPPDWDTDEGASLAVSFSKPGYEQVIWVLDCRAAGQTECHDLKVKLTPLPGRRDGDVNITLDPEEIETLDNYYRREGRALYLIPPDMPVAAGEDITTVMLESFQDTITDHLQTLPVMPPPPDITPPPDVELEPLSEMEVRLTDTIRIQLYGDYLNALAMISGMGSVQRDAAGQQVARVVFHYHMIPFHKDFEPIREIVSYTLPATELNFPERYETVSERWGFYTVLALSVSEVHAFERAKAAGDRTRLERVRAYLVAERSQLRRGEQLKMRHIQRLLNLVDQKLGERRIILPAPLEKASGGQRVKP